MISFFHFPIGGGYPIWWGRLRFRFQNSISIFKFSSRLASLNVVLVYMILCLWLCRYIIYYALHYIYDTFNALYITSHNHFTFFLINIVTFYTFFQRVCATFTHFSRQFCAEQHAMTRYAFRYSMHQTAICSANILHLITFHCIYILCIF